MQSEHAEGTGRGRVEYVVRPAEDCPQSAVSVLTDVQERQPVRVLL
jgi:hypothetical protein